MVNPTLGGWQEPLPAGYRQMDHSQMNHVSGTAVITLKSEVPDDIMRKAVERAGYIVDGIE